MGDPRTASKVPNSCMGSRAIEATPSLLHEDPERLGLKTEGSECRITHIVLRVQWGSHMRVLQVNQEKNQPSTSDSLNYLSPSGSLKFSREL